ncbi:hypothetical protein KBD33_04410, partial [Candidatus Gracilibacteria bacterium]|nr:hypothetical protein [Candidatus Gracilibacteria bacterium]
QLCKDAKEYLINYLYKVFIQIKTTSYGTIMLKEGNFIDPKIAKNQFLLHYINNYGYSKSKKMHGIYLQATQGYSEDTTSQVLSIDVLQVMNLVRVITVRGEKHIIPSHTGVESSTTKRTIEALNQKVEALEKAKAESVTDYNELVDSHNQLIEIYNAATDENGKLENVIHTSKKKIEALEDSVSRIPTLQQTIQLQATVILYLQNGDIQPLFELNHPCFQTGFRAILRRYISDIADTIGPHLSSTTSHTAVGSGSFSYHVINPLFNQISQLLDTPDWNGMIHMRNLLYLPKNGDPSKGLIYEFAEHTKNIPSLCFIDFFTWMSQQRKIGDHDFSVVFETITKRIKEKTPALQREIRDYTAKKIIELSK